MASPKTPAKFPILMKPMHWRRSRIGRYLRHLPRAKHIRGTWIHRFFGDRLFSPELWHPTRERFAAGMAVGAFFALMPPLPIQMVGAALAAYITRVNVPAAIAGTWISNPFTFPLCIYLQYRLGCLVLQREPMHLRSEDLIAELSKTPLPYIAGVLPAAILMALVSYPVTLLLWDFITGRVEASKKRRAARARAQAAD